MFAKKISCKIFLRKKLRFAKLTALLEYFENFHVRNFHTILAYKIYFTTKINQITVHMYIHTVCTYMHTDTSTHTHTHTYIHKHTHMTTLTFNLSVTFGGQ